MARDKERQQKSSLSIIGQFQNVYNFLIMINRDIREKFKEIQLKQAEQSFRNQHQHQQSLFMAEALRRLQVHPSMPNIFQIVNPTE